MTGPPATLRVHLLDPPAYTRPYDDALARALAAHAVAVTLVSSRFAYAETRAPEGYALDERFYRRARGGPGSRRRTLSGLALHGPEMLAYRRHCAAAAPDVLHVQWLTFPALDLSLLPRRPTVLTLHDPGVAAGRGRFALSARRLERLAAIIVHSPQVKAGLLKRVRGLSSEQVHVVRHGPLRGDGAPPTPASEPPREPGVQLVPASELPAELRHSAVQARPVVLFFGLLRAYKGLDTLLAAWPRVRGAELWIVGRPLERVAVLDQPPPTGVSIVRRYVSDAEQAAIFARADLVVLPYRNAGRHSFSGVLATALGSARPVLVSDIPGFEEAILSGAVATAPVGDPVALAAALRSLLDDSERRDALARAGAEFAADTLSWDRAARDTRTVYEQVLAR